MLLAALFACRPAEVPALSVAPSAWVPSVPVATFAADGPAWVEVQREGEAPARVDAVVRDGQATAALIGLPAGEALVLVPHVGEAAGDPVDWAVAAAPPLLDAAPPVVGAGSVLADGLVMAAVVDLDASGVGVWDGDGRLVWWVLVDPAWTAASPRPSRDGTGVAFAINDRARDTDEQQLVTVAWDGSVRTERATPLAHHVVVELDEGEIAWPAWDIREVSWDGGSANVLSDTLRVGTGDGDGRVVLSFFDDRGPPFVPCSHGLLPDERLGVPVYEWTHANSLVWLPDRDRLILGARLLDAVLAVDRRTGAVAWQLGGVQGTLALDPADASSHGHFSDAWDGGLLMFDNGAHHEPQVSRVVEYAVDEAAGTAVADWVLDDPDGRFLSYLGDARRLPDGSVLLATGQYGTLEEVGRDGVRRWQLQLPPGAVVGRAWALQGPPWE
ncbi:MAG: aryl-sulfate sulfotransferase [Myxococcota bacterium]